MCGCLAPGNAADEESVTVDRCRLPVGVGSHARLVLDCCSPDRAALCAHMGGQVNLMILDDEAMRLGVSGHVCELQLILESYYRLKTHAGHARYVDYRNQRAE